MVAFDPLLLSLYPDGSHYDIAAELQMSSSLAHPQLSPSPDPFTFPGPWLSKRAPLLLLQEGDTLFVRANPVHLTPTSSIGWHISNN